MFSFDQMKAFKSTGETTKLICPSAARTAEVKYALRAYLREDPHPGRALTAVLGG